MVSTSIAAAVILYLYVDNNVHVWRGNRQRKIEGGVSEVAVLKAYKGDEWQYENVECYPDEQRRCYRLRGGERRIKIIRR